MAMRIVAESARLLGAPRLIPIASAHIDGALYHGDSGTLFAERLVEGGAQRRGALDAECRRARPHGLLARPAGGAGARHGAAHDGGLSQARLRARAGPARPTRPGTGRHSAATSPGANPTPSCSAIPCSARAPTATAISSTSPARSPAARRTIGLHRPENRRATLVFDVSALPAAFLASEIAWPVLGSLYGREVGNAVGVVTGVASASGRGSR